MTALHQSRDRANDVAEKLKIYAQPQRLMILSRLMAGERTVGEIDEATGIGQPALSQQLSELRRAGLVVTRRAAKLVYYRLASDEVALCVRSIEAIFGEQDPRAALVAATVPSSRPKPQSPSGAANFAEIIG